MTVNSNEISCQLQKISIFSKCNSQDIAKMLPHIEVSRIKAGEKLFELGMRVSNLYIIINGKVNLIFDDQTIKEISDGGIIGEEVAIGAEQYLSDAIASCPTKILAIPRENVQMLIDKNPELNKDFYSSLFRHHTGRELGSSAPQEGRTYNQCTTMQVLVGWLLVFIVPALILFYSSHISLNWNSRMFLCVLSMAIVMWVFSLTSSPVVPCFLSILSLLLLGIAPSSIVLAGFSSGTFFMAISVFGLTVVLLNSGVTYRLVLIVLKYIPQCRFAYVLVMLLVGITMIPFIPDYSGRLSIIGSPLQDMINSLRYRPNGKAATQLTTATYIGATHFSNVFLTGDAVNLLVYGLLPLQIKNQFSWLNWAIAASVFTAVSILIYLIIIFFMFKSSEVPKISKEQINTQLNILGPMTSKEWVALAGVFLFVLGICASSIHKIDTPWIALAILYIFLSIDALSDNDFNKSINWSFLIYLGGMLGLVETMSFLGVDEWLISHFSWMESYIRVNFYLFCLLLAFSIVLLGLILDEFTIITFFSAILFPIAESLGINAWVIGFIILTMSYWWVLPFQEPDFLLFTRRLGTKQEMFNVRSFLTFNAISILVRLIALYASIPLWKRMGLL